MRKEDFEWIHSWCDNTGKQDLPRILLIGDSITHNYQQMVRELLQGQFYVDYISTSYSLDNPIYYQLIKSFVTNSKYAFVQYNFGLHGIHISANSYEKRIDKVVTFLMKSIPSVGIANITKVNLEGNKKEDKKWMRRVNERNAILEEISKKHNLPIVDLFTISTRIPIDLRNNDGTHYLHDGYELFAKAVASFVIKNAK